MRRWFYSVVGLSVLLTSGAHAATPDERTAMAQTIERQLHDGSRLVAGGPNNGVLVLIDHRHFYRRAAR
jgi:hypothetical protein